MGLIKDTQHHIENIQYTHDDSAYNDDILQAIFNSKRKLQPNHIIKPVTPYIFKC